MTPALNDESRTRSTAEETKLKNFKTSTAEERTNLSDNTNKPQDITSTQGRPATMYEDNTSTHGPTATMYEDITSTQGPTAKYMKTSPAPKDQQPQYTFPQFLALNSRLFFSCWAHLLVLTQTDRNKQVASSDVTNLPSTAAPCEKERVRKVKVHTARPL
eukprot:gb/GEZN01020499.1/.p1 GENE.gb/GEZN01020499.1/~~gb/GEZN01020499.1/.p1  ORF type:complete len:160 (+),score=14.62 gb/GEZN01020499.1/:79-558(+)